MDTLLQPDSSLSLTLVAEYRSYFWEACLLAGSDAVAADVWSQMVLAENGLGPILEAASRSGVWLLKTGGNYRFL